MTVLSLGDRLRQLAGELGDRPALIAVDRSGRQEVLGWRGLARLMEREARAAARRGGAVTAVPVRGDLDGVARLVGAFDAGAPVLLLDAAAPEAERERLTAEAHRLTAGAAPAGYLMPTGGSTGLPKLVLRPRLPEYDPRRNPSALFRATGWHPGQTQLLAGPPHHTAPLAHLLEALLTGTTVVLPAAFRPDQVFDLIEQHGVGWTQLTPTHLRILEPLLDTRAGALRSLRGVLHTAAPCPPATKRRWIEALGGDRVHETYGSTEGTGVTLCTGTEWLARPGTVGRGFLTQVRILDEAGAQLPPGRPGTVFMRTVGGGPAFRTVGDRGHLDEDGYLFLAGRTDDLVIIGGENVDPHEVTAALLDHPEVADAAVFGVRDDTFGVYLRALAVPAAGAELDAGRLREHLAARVAPHKLPAVIRLVPELPRSAAGKLAAEVRRLRA
ncbi:AMP-binding protein [Kitasatospora viridis]|uniref:Bile acid-coenzyme A ligase n=1 Tax=Kitasatospora viridis TaxID=281105 RepID=A0A561UHV7_9ACTN|nr:AMP-binding protein [Kitasatospora viridis]TWF98949.1 bile acid-coenzyme A ligase [Kitasatospora viridis]